MTHRLITRLRRDESGFTLIEVLVVSAMLVVIISAIAGLATTAERMAPTGNEAGLHLVEAQTGLDRMVRELRIGHNVASSGEHAVAIDVRQRSDGTTAQVTYDCSVDHPSGGGLKRCVRRVGGAEVVVVDRILNTSIGRPVFTYATRNPADPTDTRITYIEASIVVPGRGERPQTGSAHLTTLEDAAYLRNVDVLRP